ncbi:MAG: NADPH:quinone oxidoreductase family protein [Candidatus Azotimanducaceae bacterium]
MQNRQVICREFGLPENLLIEESNIPSPEKGEVLVKVLAAGVGYVDSLMVQGLYQVKPPLPYYPGSEFAGEVIQVGGAVNNIKSGDLVMGMWRGAYTDHMTVPSSECTVIPDSLSVEVAGGFYTNYSTALFGLRDCGNLEAGENVLILGASGGVGSSAITVAKAMGANVIAGASSPEKLELASSAGADETILYSKEGWRTELKALLGNESLTMVYDPVGGDLAEPAFRSLAPGGRFLVVGFASGTIPSIPLNLALLKQSSIVGVDWGGAMRSDPSLTPTLQKTLLDWIDSGRLNPAKVSTRPLSEIREALSDQISGKVIGKLVLEGNK